MTADKKPAALHKAFSWLSDKTKFDYNAEFAADASAVSQGGTTIANLIRSNSLDIGNGDAPLLNERDLDCLVGLLIFSLEALNASAEKQLGHLEKAAEKGAKQ